MRRLPRERSSCHVNTASFSLRTGLREGDSQRFFASCWVIVEAPRGSSTSSRACITACLISPVSNPWCEKKLTSSATRSEEHTSELQSLAYLVCRLLLEKKKKL